MQVVGYETVSKDTPSALRVADDGVVSRVDLSPGSTLDYGLGDRHCAGVLEDDRHVACPNEETPYCSMHTTTWPCARCTGNCTMPLEACHEEHVVYLAAFAPSTFKVGVTRTWRFDRRLREQGADRAARIRIVPNGREARRIEANLATTLTDRVPIREKIAGLHRSVDLDAWETLLESHDVEDDIEFEYGFELARQPVPATLATGRVLATKGRILVLRRGGTTYAVDIRDLLGYELSEDASMERHQSSFQAFE
ncbi:MAG: DUF2797 domain-containing protein [Halodesulfurarchaeum sp.]